MLRQHTVNRLGRTCDEGLLWKGEREGDERMKEKERKGGGEERGGKRKGGRREGGGGREGGREGDEKERMCAVVE